MARIKQELEDNMGKKDEQEQSEIQRKQNLQQLLKAKDKEIVGLQNNVTMLKKDLNALKVRLEETEDFKNCLALQD